MTASRAEFPPAEERDRAGEDRDHAADQRDEADAQRDVAGDERDVAGDRRDDLSSLRDIAGDERDAAAEQRDRAAEGSTELDGHARSALFRRNAASDRTRASEDRFAAASERSQSELDRAAALGDRGAGASARSEAELDRNIALSDRGFSAQDREHAAIDGLTGAYLRGAGLLELEREMARARRTEQPLALAFVDVDGLKAVNDEHGHAAGDKMLVTVAEVIRTRLRAYDLIVRYGGDEFVCVISGLDLAGASERLSHLSLTSESEDVPMSVSVGLAALMPDDEPEDLIARADDALYQ